MARAIWTGSITFGLVYVPVELYAATQEHRTHFHQLQKGSRQRVRYKRVAEGSGEEVDYGNIVKGVDLGKGRHVVVSEEEIEAIAPAKTRTIDIEDFVDLSAIDPVVWNKTYFLGPSGEAQAERPYALLREAMASMGKVAIGRFVMRSRQYLVTIRPFADALVLETMYFADEVRGLDVLKHRPGAAHVSPKELEMAEKLIASLSTEWNHDKYHDTYQERLMELVEKKSRGEPIATTEEEPAGAQVIDIMEALKRSLATPRSTKSAGEGQAKGTVRKGATGSEGNLAQLTKQALYERASEADIPGRSKMSREQLIQALRKVS